MATSTPNATVSTMLCGNVRANTAPSLPLRSVTETPVVNKFDTGARFAQNGSM